MARDYSDLDDKALRALHDVCGNYEERSCIRAELRKRKQKSSAVANTNNNSDIGNKNTDLAQTNETPLTNGFSESVRTIGNGDGKDGMCISRLGKDNQGKNNKYTEIEDEKTLQSMLEATRDLDERILIRVAMRTLRQKAANSSSPVISTQCETACGDTSDSNGHRPVTPVDNEVTVNCQTSQATICLDDPNRWSLADYKKRKATNMEKHLNALSDSRQTSTKMTHTQHTPEGTTAAITNSTSESSNASSDSESPASDTVITRESSGSIRITSRVRKPKNRLSGINGVFSLGKLIDNKIERELSQEGSSCAGSSECGSQGTNEDVSEDDTKKEGDEPSAAESLAQELKELENKLHSSRDFEVRQKLRADIREIRALIKELGSGVQPPAYTHRSTTATTQPEQYVSIVPSNSETVVPGSCETVVIEHHVPHDVVRHHRHVSPRASFLSDRDVVIATSSDSDKEEEAAIDEQNMTSCEQGDSVTSPPPRIITPLTNQTVTTGQSTTLECMVVNGDDASIRWFQDAEQLDPSEEFEHIFDGSVAKLVIAAIQSQHAGTYRCLVRTTGGDTETSASIVVEAPRCAPDFTEPLTDVTSQEGDQVVLQCRLCGMPLPRVTWYHNATLVRDRAESSQSFDSGVVRLTLSPVSCDLAGDYQCVARNMSGESRTVCQLTVEEAPDTAPEETAPEFTSPLTDTHVDDGDTVTLECHVTGQPTPDVTWHKDDKLLPNCSDSCQSYVNGVAKLVLADIVGSGAGVYLCTAKNQAGEAKSEANVSVRVQAPKPAAPAQPTKQPVFLRPLEDMKITEGDTLVLECSVAAHPKPSVDWIRNREPFEATPECSLSFDGTTARLQIDAVSSKFAGMYKCVVKNSLGSARTLCNLSVRANRSGRSTRSTKHTFGSEESTGSDVTTRGYGTDGRSNGIRQELVNPPLQAVITNVETSSSVNIMGDTDTSDINSMEDEEKLHDLLSRTDNFDERRKIRAKLRAVREKKSEEWAQKRSERENARVEANKLRQQQSEQAKQRKLKQYEEQAKDQRKGSGVVEEGLRRRVAEADAEKQRKLEQYKEIGKVMSAAYHAGSDMATRNAISVADKDKERRLQDFEEEAVTRTMSSEQLEDGSVSTTSTTVSTQKSKDGKTTTVRQTKQVTKVGGIGGTAYVTNRPGAEDTARRLANTFAQRGYPQTSGLIRVKTDSWSGQDGVKHRAQKACSWAGGGRTGPRSAMAAFQGMDAANGPTGGRPNIGGGRVGVQRSASTIKQMLLDWCRSMTREYENVDITNFSSSWNNGMAFCALIHHFFPNAFEYSKLNPKNRRFNFTLGFEVAEKMAGIAPLLDVEDMVRMKNPDWKCVFTTVQSYYRWYRTQENKKEAEAAKSPSPATPVAAT